MADAKAKTATVSVSLAIAWPLSLCLILFALPSMLLPVVDQFTGAEPTFTSFRDEVRIPPLCTATR